MRKLTIAALAAAMLAGCVSGGTKVDAGKVQDFQRGVTTYAQVVATLGAPNADTLTQDGTRIIAYVYTQAAARPQSFIPIVGPLVAKADATSDSYTFTFDEAGVLKSSSTIHTQATSHSLIGN